MDTVFLALRVAVALGAVFGALLITHRWITKGRPGSQPRNRQIAVVARQGLGAKAGIAVVDAGGRRYLLGVTEHAVTVLDTLGAAEGQVAEPSVVASRPIAVAAAPGTRSDADADALRSSVSAMRARRFEQELRTVALDGAEATAPWQAHAGRTTQALAVIDRPDVSADLIAATAEPAGGASRAGSVSFSGSPTAGLPVYTSRRAMREAEHAAALQQELPQRPAPAGPLAGSVLSPSTWRQTFDALKKLR